jgi:hypothetical protein
MPGGAGYLGVCFGPLITMNSPAGTGAATVSCRSVLWHEYTHVVTLGLTHNKIPPRHRRTAISSKWLGTRLPGSLAA